MYFQGGGKYLSKGIRGNWYMCCTVLEGKMVEIVQIFENDDSGINVIAL
jgi:hypothetical protein